ncbi:MAG: hypothetical protein WBD47_22890 [Phormidesmis sp.]
MEALEFQTQIKNGMIEIPAIHKPDLAEGAQIKVIVLKQSGQQLIEAFKGLLKDTQALPQIQTITDEDIAAEIKAYRAGR